MGSALAGVTGSSSGAGEKENAALRVVLVNVWMDTERGGGTAERTRHLALHLTKLGCRCSILTMGATSWRDEFERAGVSVISVPHLGKRFPLPLISWVRLFGIARQADVILVTGFWYLLAAAASLASRLTRGTLVVCPAGSLTRFGRNAPHKRLYHFLAGRWMLATAASVMATTAQERNLLISDFAIPSDAIFVSPNGVNAHVPDDWREDVLPTGRIVLFVGRLTSIKAPDLLLEAYAQVAKKISGASLVFAGPDHGLRAQLERRTIELGLSASVHFVGHVDEQMRTRLFQKAELLVIPSHSEVMSLVALEAGVMGVPVVLTDQCGFDEVAEVDGGLVINVNVQALADAIGRMMSDPIASKDRGNRLRQFVLTHYAWPSVAVELKKNLVRLQSRSSGKARGL